MAWSDYDQRRRRPRPSSAEASHFRRVVLERANHRCEIRGPKCLGTATAADHVVPWAQGGSNDPIANGQAVCDPCHNEKTQAEAAYGRNRWKRRPPRHPGLDPL